MSNIYSALLDSLSRQQKDIPGVLFGTLLSVSPLTVQVEGTTITRGLFYPRGSVFQAEHIGRELALLPCDQGFLILFQTEGVEV